MYVSAFDLSAISVMEISLNFVRCDADANAQLTEQKIQKIYRMNRSIVDFPSPCETLGNLTSQ
jgi:hypothetical protein